MASSDAGGSGFDPRFDPAFQPGYDPGSRPSDAGARPQRQSQQQADAYAPSESMPARPSRPEIRQAPPVAPPPASSFVSTSASPSASPPVDGPIVVHGPAVPGAADDPSPRRRISNPLIVALWILSAVFIAAGLYSLRLIGDRVTQLGANGGFGGADYYLLQSYTVGAPLLIVLGLATATGTLFLFAARWKGRG